MPVKQVLASRITAWVDILQQYSQVFACLHKVGLLKLQTMYHTCTCMAIIITQLTSYSYVCDVDQREQLNSWQVVVDGVKPST